ncbi:MAG: AMP-binding protein [Phycisphaerales bacterium]|nr:AMP-binding protein [Phycisphaerales bacterium]
MKLFSNLGMALTWSFFKRAKRVMIEDDSREYRGIDLLVAGMHVADLVDGKAQSPRVGILVPTSGAFAVAAYGVWLAGKTIVPLNYLSERETLEYVIDDAGCDLVIASRKLIEHLGYVPKAKTVVYLEDMNFKCLPSPRLPRWTSREDLAVVLYTSGTSGKPKGVMLSHRNMMSNVGQIHEHIAIKSSDVFFGVLPQFHSFGITALTLLPLLFGCKVIYSARFIPKRVVEGIEKHGATIYIGIPSMYNALMTVKSAEGDSLSSLRISLSGGEPLPRDVSDRFFERFGVRICEGYGLTETAPVTNVMLPGEESKVGAVGRPLPRVVQRIVDPETGREVGVDVDGELRIGGPNVMQGYLNLPELTAEVFDECGHLRTGDMARIDSDGFLSITGRIKEMMIIGGENVFPREIEEVLNAHPSVGVSGVIGQHDPMRGEVPVGFVECVEGESVDGDVLIRWCRDRLAGYKVPRRIVVIDAMPRNATGKVLRRSLSEMLD